MSFKHSLFLGLILASALLLGGFAACVLRYPLDLSSLEHYNPGKPCIVLDETGQEIMRFQHDKRNPVSLSKMPSYLLQSFIATEDRTFYSHHGIYWRGILRSLFVNLRHGRVVQGGSTITQQLVKLLFCTQQRTLSRKIKEQLLAFVVEYQFTKEQIIETYLNHVYFGGGIYGVAAAAQRFWNMRVEDLTIDQCATLAGIVKSPGHYSPLYHPDHTLSRRNLVLKLMHLSGFITQQEYERSTQTTLQLYAFHETPFAHHAKEMIRNKLETLIGPNKLYTAGYTIKVTLNKQQQQNAEKSLRRHLGTIRKNVPECEGAIVSLDVSTGAIRSLVGGCDFKNSQFNRACQAHRQMGSLFKPLSYATALTKGATFADTMVDEPFTQVNNWTPRNVHRRHEGTITLARALSSSNNIVSIKTLLQAGIEDTITLAKKLRLPGPLPACPALALGCTECTPLQAAAMMNTFVNKGTYQQPYLLEWIKDRWGKKIWKHTPFSEKAMSWETSSQMVKALQIVNTHLKQRMPSLWIKGESMGKTGTTNNKRSCWFAGATPSLTTVVYLGCDNNQSMNPFVYSVRNAVPLWLDVNRPFATKNDRFYHSPHLHEVTIHPKTGCAVPANTPRGLSILMPQL